MAVKTDLLSLTSKGRTIPADVRPPCHLLASNGSSSITEKLQVQCLVTAFGLPPTLAADVAEMFWGRRS